MSGIARAGSYRRLLTDPAAARTFVIGLVGRLGYAVFPLIFLFTVRDSTKDFATAAAAMSLFGLAVLAAPIQMAVAVRHGQRHVLPVVAVVFVAALGACVALAANERHAGAWFVVSVVLGLSAPALGPCMRAQWRVFAVTDAERSAAYSLDAVCEETLYLVGPIVAAGMLARGPAWHGLVLVAVLIAVGAAGLTMSPAAKVRVGDARLRTSGEALRPLQVRRLLLLTVGFGAAMSLMYTGIAARADAAGQPAQAGYVEAAVVAASVAGGLAWGNRGHRHSWPAHLAAMLIVLACATTVAAMTVDWLALTGALLAAGAVLSPIFAVAYGASDVESIPRLRTQTSTWVTTSTNVGSSAGTAIAALAVQKWGPGAPLWLSGAVALVTAAVAILFACRGRS